MQELITFSTHHPLLISFAVLVFILVIVIEILRAKRSSFSVTPAQATQLINRQHAVIIDIRSPEEFRKNHIIDAISIPVPELRGNTKKIEKFKTKPIILVCNKGIESQKVAALLQKQGYNSFSLAGGLTAWSDAQMPLVKE